MVLTAHPSGSLALFRSNEHNGSLGFDCTPLPIEVVIERVPPAERWGRSFLCWTCRDRFLQRCMMGIAVELRIIEALVLLW